MSKFRKTSNKVKEIEKNLGELNDQISESSDDRPIDTIKSQLETINMLSEQLTDVQPAIEKYVKIAKITDEDKIVYGPKMVTNVLSMNETYQTLLSQCAEIQERLNEEISPIHQKEEKELEEQKRRIAELEEKRRIEEEEEKRRKEAQKEAEKKKQEQEELERKRAEEEKKKRERQEYEEQRDIQDERHKRLLSATEKKITPNEALSTLQENCDDQAHTDALTALLRIVTAFTNSPENNPFHKIRVKNEEFQKHIGCHVGGEECLISIGYLLKLCLDDPSQGWQWIMEEPSPTDLDQWSEWYTSLTNLRDGITNALINIG